MRFTLVPDDKLICIDSVAVHVDSLDGIDPNITAVQYDDAKGWGEIEFREVDPDGDGPELPYKPANEKIRAERFEADFRRYCDVHAEKVAERPVADDTPPAPEPVSPANTPVESAPEAPAPAPALDIDPILQMLQLLDARLTKVEQNFIALGNAAQQKLEELPNDPSAPL